MLTCSFIEVLDIRALSMDERNFSDELSSNNSKILHPLSSVSNKSEASLFEEYTFPDGSIIRKGSLTNSLIELNKLLLML